MESMVKTNVSQKSMLSGFGVDFQCILVDPGPILLRFGKKNKDLFRFSEVTMKSH